MSRATHQHNTTQHNTNSVTRLRRDARSYVKSLSLLAPSINQPTNQYHSLLLEQLQQQLLQLHHHFSRARALSLSPCSCSCSCSLARYLHVLTRMPTILHSFIIIIIHHLTKTLEPIQPLSISIAPHHLHHSLHEIGIIQFVYSTTTLLLSSSCSSCM
jgi:hypothetical protein